PGIAVAAAVHQKKGRLSFLHDMVIIYGNFWTGNTISFRALQGGRNNICRADDRNIVVRMTTLLSQKRHCFFELSDTL
ncbi:hypothetical protein, partial [Desulfoscipio gibsoniae]